MASDLVTCPLCGSHDLHIEGESTTLMGWSKYQDEKGRHSHNPNRVREGFMCRKCKHHFEKIKQQTCPNPLCDWKGDYGSQASRS